ncbi:hypothetical protein AB4589_25160 [Vibrio sp. 10N.222.49.A3]|uniref:hypothetical protein n=1 Tax=Vibrio sp. 10N.222.49.A3 TaxID=3229611 RepID=UPI00354C6F94
MATTIQVTENLNIGQHADINGQRCEVEAVSFYQAITAGHAAEELMNVMAHELIQREIIKVEGGQYYFCEDGEPLIADEQFEDE